MTSPELRKRNIRFILQSVHWFRCLALAFLAGFKPFSVKFMEAGLSPSWIAASTLAQTRQLMFGFSFCEQRDVAGRKKQT
jgi:hypothetical protein